MKIRNTAIGIIIAALLASGLAGCQSNDENLETNGDTPLKFTIFLYGGASEAFKDSWPIFKKAEELTNVSLKGVIPQSNSGQEQAFSIMMASGDIADIIKYKRGEINKYAVDGAFLPLDDLINKYAPHIKKFLQENPWVRKGSIASDGNLYFIPKIADGEVSEGWFIRKDWLDKLGLEVPKTVEEYYSVLKAFRENDANGNGKKDEVPYMSRSPKLEVAPLLALYGTRVGFYEKDDKVFYGHYTPEYKTAIKNIVKWYQERLIDNEIYTRDHANARDALFGDNLAGSIHDWIGSSADYNDIMKDKVPGFSLIPIAPPADINGQVKELSNRDLLGNTGWGISASCKNPEAVIKYFDFWFTEEGRKLYNFGIEGVHHTMVDGKPRLKDEILHGKESVPILMMKDGALLDIGAQANFEQEEQWLNPIAKEGIKMYVDNKYNVKSFPPMVFTPDEQKVLTAKWAAIDSFIKEKEQKWVLGAESVDSTFDAYISKLKDMGMEEVLKVYNSAYQRYKSN